MFSSPNKFVSCIFFRRLYTKRNWFIFLVKLNRNQIVFTIFRLILIQTDVRLDQNQSENVKYNLITCWFNLILKRFLCVLLLDSYGYLDLFVQLEDLITLRFWSEESFELYRTFFFRIRLIFPGLLSYCHARTQAGKTGDYLPTEKNWKWKKPYLTFKPCANSHEIRRIADRETSVGPNSAVKCYHVTCKASF